jgi:uncharacterized lipoprotein YajG
VAQLSTLDGYTFMKNTLLILLSAFLLFGCSKKNAVPAIDLVKAGKDVAWSDGYVLHVVRRDGASIEGIRIVHKGQDGQVTTTTADSGTVSSLGAVEKGGVLYTNFVNIVLENAHAQRADGAVKEYKEVKFFLHQ